MPTQELTLEQRFAKLVLGLCEVNRASIGLPAAAALPFRHTFQTGDRKLPNVAFHAETFEQAKNRNLVQLKVEIVVQAKHADTNEASQADWTKKIRSIVRHEGLWKAYIQTLSEADRTGWRILRYLVEHGGMTFDSETELRSMTTSVKIFVETDELKAL